MTLTHVSIYELPQASTAVAIVNTGVAGQFMVVGAGSAAMTGAALS